MIDWILDNKEWIFSGIGVSIFGLISFLIKKRTKSIKQVQKGGDYSTNIQSARDININKDRKGSNDEC